MDLHQSMNQQIQINGLKAKDSIKGFISMDSYQWIHINGFISMY